MTTYNTGNPIGSKDPRDLYDNAENLDNFVNGDQATYNDRLGKSRRSWQSVEDQANQQKFEFKADQTSREQQFAAFITSGGYQFAGDYAAGIEITQYNQLVRDENGEFWRVSGPTPLPYTTTGAGMPEGGAFVNVGDASVRQEFQKGQLRSTNYTTDRAERRGGLNAHSINLTSEVVRPVVSFIDDDGSSAFLTKLKPIFDSKGVKSALAVYTSGIGSGSRLTWQEVLDLYGEGYEIMSHTHTNLNLAGVSASQAEYEFAQSRYELESRGIDVESFVYVQGARGSDEVKNLVRKYFRSAYVTLDGGIQAKPLQDWFIRRKDAVAQTVGANPTLQELKDLVDYAEANNEWAVFTTHAHYAGMDTAQQQVISDLIDYIQGKGIEILTPSKALDIHGSRFFTGDSNDERFQTAPHTSSFFKIDKHGVPYPAGARVITTDGRDQSSPITDYAPNEITVFRPALGDDWPLIAGSNTVVVETYYIEQAGAFGFQRITQERTGETRHRSWNRTTGDWDDWRQYEYRQYLGRISDGSKLITDYPANSVSTELVGYNSINFPESESFRPGLLVTYSGSFSPTQHAGYQVYTPNRRPYYYTRTWDFDANQWRDWVREQQIAGGATGTFTTADSKTVTVTNGIITGIS